jgi:hypothetical protein
MSTEPFVRGNGAELVNEPAEVLADPIAGLEGRRELGVSEPPVKRQHSRQCNIGVFHAEMYIGSVSVSVCGEKALSVRKKKSMEKKKKKKKKPSQHIPPEIV